MTVLSRRLELKLAIVADGRPAWQIAAEAGISPNTLSNIIVRRQEPKPVTRRRLAEVLGRDERDLFEQESA